MHWQAHIRNIIAGLNVRMVEVVVVRDQELNMKEALRAINMNIRSHDMWNRRLKTALSKTKVNRLFHLFIDMFI